MVNSKIIIVTSATAAHVLQALLATGQNITGIVLDGEMTSATNAIAEPAAPTLSRKMQWDEAMEALKQGKRVRREGWDDGSYVVLDPVNLPHLTIVNGTPPTRGLWDMKEVQANDWLTVET